MAKYQIVIETDVYEKSPISDNYVFEGKGFAGSVNPNSPNVTVKKVVSSGEKCYCDEPDVYDGYAECPVHGAASWTDARQEKVRDLLQEAFWVPKDHADEVMRKIMKVAQ